MTTTLPHDAPAGGSALHVDESWTSPLESTNPLAFAGYTPPRAGDESTRIGRVSAPRGDYVLIECDFSRFGGTMGVVAGEQVVRAYRRATELRLPVAAIVSSGGARLQEGFFALLQMGRTASAAAAHRAAGLRSAVAFRSPTTGGVFASWANTADLRAVDPAAVIGFGGPRVVEAVTGSLPIGSHTAESMYRDGNVDALVPAAEQQTWLETAIGVRAAPAPPPANVAAPVGDSGADSWGALLAVREPRQPSGMDWVAWLASEWVEIRGSGPRIRAGVARIGETDVAVVAMDRSRDDDLLSLPTPADFRLVQRTLRFAGRSGLPVLTLIDTPGADPSPASEKEGLAREIAHTLLTMSDLPTPSVAFCVGEGGSGGAMALAHADTLLLLEGSVFAVIGPEPGSAVLYRDVARAPELARAMRISARELASFGFGDIVTADVDAVRRAIVAALDPSRLGERVRRPERVTLAALRG